MDKKTFKKYSAIIFIILIILTLLTVALFKKSDAQKVSINAESVFNEALKCGFSVKVNLSSNDTDLSADILKQDDVFTATVTSPDTLCGMVFTYSADTVNVSYKDMSVDINSSSAPALSLTGSVVDVFKACSNKSYTAVYSAGDTLTLNGEVENTDFTLTIDKQSGTPISLTMPKLNLKCEFFNFSKK